MPAGEPFVARYDAAVDVMYSLSATAPEGHRARARALAMFAPDLVDEPEDYLDQRLIAAILRDLAAGGAP